MIAVCAAIALLFEVAQIFVAQRFIGLRQIREGSHPTDEVPPMGNALACGWIAALTANSAWQFGLLLWDQTRLFGVLMLGVTVIGVACRRAYGMKGALVVMTIEGAARIGFNANLISQVLF